MAQGISQGTVPTYSDIAQVQPESHQQERPLPSRQTVALIREFGTPSMLQFASLQLLDREGYSGTP